MKGLKVDVNLLGKQRLLLEQILDAKNLNRAHDLIVNESELLEGLENMLSEVRVRLLSGSDVLLRRARVRAGGAQ